MRNTFHLLLISVAILCSAFLESQGQTSIARAATLIKKHVSTGDREVTKVTIVNSHNGRYTIICSILSGAATVRLSVRITDMTGGIRDTVMDVDKRTFLISLEEASLPINSTRFAGHHQRIVVNKHEAEETFETVDGRRLMNLLEYGE